MPADRNRLGCHYVLVVLIIHLFPEVVKSYFHHHRRIVIVTFEIEVSDGTIGVFSFFKMN